MELGDGGLLLTGGEFHQTFIVISDIIAAADLLQDLFTFHVAGSALTFRGNSDITLGKAGRLVKGTEVGIGLTISSANGLVIHGAGFRAVIGASAFSIVKEGNSSLQVAGSSLKIAKVGIGASIGTANWEVDHGAHLRAGNFGFSLSGAFAIMSNRDLGLSQAGLLLEGAKVGIGLAIGTANGLVIICAHNVTRVLLCNWGASSLISNIDLSLGQALLLLEQAEVGISLTIRTANGLVIHGASPGTISLSTFSVMEEGNFGLQVAGFALEVAEI